MAQRMKVFHVNLFLMGIFASLAFGIIISGYSYLHNQREIAYKQCYSALDSISRMKADQISSWLNERMNDARVQTSGGIIALELPQWLSDRKNEQLQGIIAKRLRAFDLEDQYSSVLLLDKTGALLMSNSSGPLEISSVTRQKVLRALRSKEVVSSDLYWCDSCNHALLDIIAPLLTNSQRESSAIGALVFRINPGKFLYPLVESWPVPSKTSETIIVRREGGDVLFLSELRYRKGMALKLRIPLTRTELPAVKAVSGYQGIFQGRDYRGIEVLSAVKPIPGSAWFMVAKMDRREVMAPINKMVWWISIMIILLILLAGAVVAEIFHLMQVRHYRELYLAEIEPTSLAKRYDYLTKYANDIILLLDDQLNIIEANDRALEAYGYSQGEILILSAKNLFAPSTIQELENQIAEIWKQGNARFETLHQRKDGSIFSAEMSIQLIEIEGTQYLQSIIRDITDRKNSQNAIQERSQELREANQLLISADQRLTVSEEVLKAASADLRLNYKRLERLNKALRESEEQFRSLYENSVIGLYRTTPDGRIVMVNPALVRMLRYQSTEELMQKNLEQEGYEVEYPRKQFKEKIETEGVITGLESAWKRRDGTTIFVRESACVIRDANGKAIYYEGTVEDITEQKELESEKEIVEAQLRQAQKMEAVGQLAGGIAHDFNNMLTGIMGSAELLHRKMQNEPELLSYVEKILSAAQHSSQLTGQLLTFARKSQFKLEALDIHKVTKETIGILKNTIDRRIRIEQNLQASPSTIIGDYMQLENALMNLGLNARDAMPQGGELTFSTQIVELDAAYAGRHPYKIIPGNYVQITVRDNGTGMSPEVKEHLFEPFFTTKEPGKGTGLGLASVYGIIKSLSGSIEVYSEANKGTAVKIYLPLSEKQIDEAMSPEPLNLPMATGTILLIDDEDMVRDIAVDILESQGFKAIPCKEGPEAIEYYRTNHQVIDLIIVDMIMPKMSGKDTFLALCQINPNVKALLSSGFSADGDAKDILALGAKGFVRKPFRIKELVAKVNEVLNAK